MYALLLASLLTGSPFVKGSDPQKSQVSPKEIHGIVIQGKPKAIGNNVIKCKGRNQVCATFDENGEGGVLARIYAGDDVTPTEQFTIESYRVVEEGDETTIYYVPAE